MAYIFRAALLYCALLASGCASILSGTSQTVTINTNPPGARCELVREGRIIGTVEKTPGAVTLKKTKHDIDISCKKAGYIETKEFAKSGTEGATFGNLILSGGIGWAIDSAAGADNKYPEVLTVTMVPTTGGAPASKKTVVAAANRKETGASDSNDAQRRLQKLKEMKDGGLLTDEEYQSKRKEILGTL